MRIFHCDHCKHLLFFESVQCLGCGLSLAYLPDREDIGSLEPAGEGTWKLPGAAAGGATYRKCANYDQENICNWAVPSDDPNPLCVSCRLTRIIPNLSKPGSKDLWFRLETAKRRLIYSLLSLGLPLRRREAEGDGGVAFEFLADPETPGAEPVLTGHNQGLITINLAEADDAEREKRRTHMQEPYRTLLGHFRHEIGHYYWDRLIRDGNRDDILDGFRALFGDERQDYAKSLERHYQEGAPPDWNHRFVSAYASSHPWEDWAETWAHYLHMVDSLETASACGLSLRPRRADEPSLDTDRQHYRRASFDRMIQDWFPLTYVLNNLNRGLGLPDGYPFVLPPPAVEKLGFVDRIIEAAGKSAAGVNPPGARPLRP